MGQKVAPVAAADTYTLGINFTLERNVSNGLLSNDNDANGDATMNVQTSPISNPSNGLVVLNSDGSFSYTPNNGFLGADSFRYRVCDDGSPNDIVSRFDFNNPDLTIATIGPDATSVNPLAAQLGCGVYFPTGAGGSTGFDINIPNTGGIFNFTSFTASFEYEDQESTADIITAGNFRVYHITGNQIGIRVDVINGSTGLANSFTVNLGNFVAGNNTYIISYDELKGAITYTANGTTTLFNVAPAFSPLNTALASDILLGRFMDGSGSTRPSFCSMEFIDDSKLCDEADVILNVTASVITNRKITYRVKPN
ncbi:MAG: Ig-like domain-containing protein [Maribacter sp.]